ncbi:hypothetical protein BKP45_01790 [Anaerobacillus alkalidiazotrophicus]|uniref:Uncharacterized protein n=1 Tax=Anaerobacillus alkalidiazotrophicus TaxID=472963 RepID=A0A1S2MAC0_9BACI|nr:HU family DNA-binding protein [Anaerobacillus alkalidiazotrophicus]OIJ21524.1 hypothetical protein BKP45_01790 [Anaerobacillus alkalidiazotrophicus]
MNKLEVAGKVSEKSGVNIIDCKKVIDAFEEVLSDELSNSGDISSAFDKVYNVLSFLKNKKR